MELRCSHCNSYLCLYQKDGPGILKRLYVDRIQRLENIDKKLTCERCGKALGSLGIYEKENRPAYILTPGTISKKIIKIP